MKTFYFDVETCGLDCKATGMTQLAAILVIDGQEVDKISLDINTYSYNREVEVSEEALNITNKTEEMIKSYPSSKEQFNKLIKFLDKYINKYDKSDKLTPVGYNSQFDMGFLIEWFKDNDHKFFGSYFIYKDVDVFALIKHLAFLGYIDSDSHKLGTMCDYFGVSLGDDAHDAIADIRATRELYQLLVDKYIKG